MGQPHKSDQMSVEKAPLNGASVEDCKELYNFGHAPFEVIQKFQDFCMTFQSLSAALMAILKREVLLKRKYNFISTPVMYQMLAKPTDNDSEDKLKSSFDALKKFARKGRYECVANAIEELLFSPIQTSESYCDKSTWTYGNVGSNYTELSVNEQIVLEQIADTLVEKIAALTPEKHRRSRKRAKKDKDKSTPSKKFKSNEKVSGTPPQKLVVNIQFPVKKPKPLPPPGKVPKPQNNHLCLNTATHSTKVNHLFNAVDADMLIPIQRFVKTSQKEIKTKKKNIIDDTKEVTKSLYCENFLNLLPSEKESIS